MSGILATKITDSSRLRGWGRGWRKNDDSGIKLGRFKRRRTDGSKDLEVRIGTG